MNRVSQEQINYIELIPGYEFEPAALRLDSESLTAYFKAVEGDNGIYKNNQIVPPVAIAALAMRAMAASISMPPGTIHVSQDMQFLGLAGPNEAMTSHAIVNRNVKRGKFHMLTISINVLDRNNKPLLTGETSFILPTS